MLSLCFCAEYDLEYARSVNPIIILFRFDVTDDSIVSGQTDDTNVVNWMTVVGTLEPRKNTVKYLVTFASSEMLRLEEVVGVIQLSCQID